MKTFNMMKNLKNMPEDLIPYWDMSAPNIPNEPRDVSTASCIASALYEISTMDVPDAPAINVMPTVSWFLFLLRLTGLHWVRTELPD